MITLNLTNLQKIAPEHGLSEAELDKKIDKIPRDFYPAIDETAQIQKINEFAAKAAAKFEHFVLLGIGGSALGTSCLQKALKPDDEKLTILDNIDPDVISRLDKKIDYAKTLFLVVSKSGETTETISQYTYFRAKLEKKSLPPKEHFIFVTNPEKGFLRETAKKDSIETFDIPQNISGRFSIFTPTALLPAKLIGIDIEKLIAGAKSIKTRFLSPETKENLPFTLATIRHSLFKKGKTINVLMPYAQALTGLSDWYRQLLAESIGKNLSTGITPVSALGATDQHSQLQLYNDGPNDKLIVFIEREKFATDPEIPEKAITFGRLMQIEKSATEISLTKNNRPNITIKVDSISEETLGEMLMMFMGEIAFLGELFGVNAFDQPGVELAKKLIKESL
ncbi:MAG: glucose-6-phosphate isomerase [Candidatus Peregrinibacteria bacterium]